MQRCRPLQAFLLLSAAALMCPDSRAQATYETLRDIAYYEQAHTPKVGADKGRLDLYYPTHRQDFVTVVFLHAGGLKAGKRYIPGELTGQGFAIAAVDYRLHPQVEAPAYIEDAAAAVAWVINHIEDYGGDPDRVVVAGASAGGYLALMVGLDKTWLERHGLDANRLAGMVSLSGQAITHVTVRQEQGIKRDQPWIDGLAPLHHVRKDAPPLLLVTGDRELELLGRYEEVAYLARMMKVVGHEATELHEIKGADHPAVERPGHGYLSEFVARLESP